VIYVLEGVPTASIKVDCTNPSPGNPLYLKRSFSLPSISLGLPFRWSERLLLFFVSQRQTSSPDDL
jgi:hypothetical protein